MWPSTVLLLLLLLLTESLFNGSDYTGPTPFRFSNSVPDRISMQHTPRLLRLVTPSACSNTLTGFFRQWYPVLAVKNTDPGRAHAVQVSLGDDKKKMYARPYGSRVIC